MKIKAVGFDIGGTLTKNKQGLNWLKHYSPALMKAFLENDMPDIDNKYIDIGIKILKKYNTRINPRLIEVTSKQIFTEILEECNLDLEVSKFSDPFFNYFYTESEFHSDSIHCLKDIANAGYKLGYFSDVAYGQSYNDKHFGNIVKELKKYSNVLLTSADVGYRKPSPKCLEILASNLKCKTTELMYIGDEEKDVVAANKVQAISVFIDRKGNNFNYNQQFTIKSLEELHLVLGY